MFEYKSNNVIAVHYDMHMCNIWFISINCGVCYTLTKVATHTHAGRWNILKFQTLTSTCTHAEKHAKPSKRAGACLLNRVKQQEKCESVLFTVIYTTRYPHKNTKLSFSHSFNILHSVTNVENSCQTSHIMQHNKQCAWQPQESSCQLTREIL